MKHLADSANFKGGTFNKHCNGLISWSFEIPASAYYHSLALIKMTKRLCILILISFSAIAKCYCQNDYFNEMTNNMSWRDSMECYMLLNHIQNPDYAFIMQDDIVVYRKRREGFKKISKHYDFVCLNKVTQKATRYEIEKIIQKRRRRFEDTDTNSRRFIINKESWDYKKTFDFFKYVDSLHFHKLNNDSLTNRCGLPDSLGFKKCIHFSDIGDEIIYLKNQKNYHSVRSLFPEKYIEYFPDNNNQRRIFIKCRNRFIELMNNSNKCQY